MSTTTNTRATRAATASRSLAASATFKTFATVFAFSTAALYVVCDMMNWPLFTYHPGTNQVDLFYAPPRKGEGPAMYWYGWTATSMLAAAVLGVLATFLPEHVARKIPLALVWIVPGPGDPVTFLFADAVLDTVTAVLGVSMRLNNPETSGAVVFTGQESLYPLRRIRRTGVVRRTGLKRGP